MWAIFSFFLNATYSIISLTVLLGLLSPMHPLLSFFYRLLASYFSLLICATYGVIVSIFFRVVGHKGLSQWATARSFKYVMRFTTGVTFTIEDPNNYLNTTRPAVFIGNHQTELDVLMLGCIFPKYCSVTAKSSLKRMPFLGWFMALSGTVFIDRQNSSSARNAMAGAADQMTKHNQSVYMFPEGTRSYYKKPGLLPFKKGAFHLAVQAGVPVVPVVVQCYSHVLHLKSWNFRGGEVRVKVLKPISTKGLTAADVEDLTRDTREKMLEEVIALTAKQRGQPMGMSAQQGNGVVKASGTEATITS